MTTPAHYATVLIMKTEIYGCYEAGGAKPVYIGSHNVDAREGASYGLKRRYATKKYLGSGFWINDTGKIVSHPKVNQKTKWGAHLIGLSDKERLAIVVKVYDIVDESERAFYEKAAIQCHQPVYNTNWKQSDGERREKWNGYIRGYLPEYYKRRPEKLEAKRKADRERIRAKRAAAKAEKELLAKA